MNEAETFAKLIIAVGWAKPEEITGCSDEQIAELETRYRRKLPAAYKQYLKALGQKAGRYSDDAFWTYRDIDKAQERAQEILCLKDEPIALPSTWFAFETGDYNFLFFATADGEDPPVYLYEEGDDAPSKKAESFTSWLTAHGSQIRSRYDQSLETKKYMQEKGISPGIIHGPQ